MVILLGSKLKNKKRFNISRVFTFSNPLKSPNRLLHLLQNVLVLFRLKVLSRKQQEAATNKEEIDANLNEIKVLSNCPFCLLVKHQSAFEQGSVSSGNWLITSIWNVYIFLSKSGQEIFTLLLLFLPC